ncbi:MAG: response regulator, partial [Anaerolineae bacterium]|nr:response regulator [Anaerolineae bacterium]
RQLRRLLLDAIASLQPADGYIFGSIRNRAYDVLHLRYVEGNTITDIADEIGITERQIYRDLQRAREELAGILAAMPVTAEAATSAGTPAEEALTAELGSLALSQAGLDIAELLRRAVANTAGLAAALGTSVRLAGAEGLPRVVADPGTLGQILTQAVSMAIQLGQGGAVSVSAAPQGEKLEVSVTFPLCAAQAEPADLAVLARVARAQNVACEFTAGPAGTGRLAFGVMAASPRKLLVIDDNPGAMQLYRRYLAHSPEWALTGVEDARIAADVAKHVRPDVIMLDIMMPRFDGWSVLRALRAQAETATVPVLVCSIFDDTPLARSLGATACLRKPISQTELLHQLERCLTPCT